MLRTSQTRRTLYAIAKIRRIFIYPHLFKSQVIKKEILYDNRRRMGGILGAYNTAIFPMQIITIIVAALLTYFLFAKPGTRTNSFIKAYLAFTFAWIGIVFYLILGKELTGNYFWASLFIIIAILFAVDISTKKLNFRYPKRNGKNIKRSF